MLLSQIRFTMKSWAFIRSNLFRGMSKHADNHKKTDGDDAKVNCVADSRSLGSRCPDFSKHLYFLFAPTLVYRDNYPRYLGKKVVWEVEA